MRIISLNGPWQVKEGSLKLRGAKGLKRIRQSPRKWLAAQVPGDIHLDLMRNGQMSEPLYALNAKTSRWVEERSWWYRTKFRVSRALLINHRIELIFEGIDLYGEVFLNHKHVGTTKNALVEHRFNVKPLLKAGVNELVVRVTVGTELVGQGPNLSKNPERNDSRRVHLRKAQFSYGFDWVDSLPNIGIWRSVRIEAMAGAYLADVALRYGIIPGGVTPRGHHGTPWDCPDKNTGRVQAEVFIENLSDIADFPCEVSVTMRSPSGRRYKTKACTEAQPGMAPVRLSLPIKHPELWWPNGMGPQNLYEVSVLLKNKGKTLDARSFHYGLRTITVDRSRLNAKEHRFCIQVNGQDVFCRGANWIPPDAILARATPQKYQALVAEAKDANFTMLRVWGGGIYEDDAFYDACDRDGILIWQDFMFACGLYPDDNEAFCQEVLREAELAVRRLRHHPCMALWCGNNENNWMFSGKPGLSGGGAKIYGQILPQVCHALDPDRPYWTSSPCGGPEPNSEEAGDCHWWIPATMNRDMQRRIDPFIYDECYAKFVSEYGVIGPPVKESIRRYLPGQEPRRNSAAWQEHTNTYEKGTLPAAIRYHYCDKEQLSLDEYILYGQLFQGTMYGYSLESLRFRTGQCQGALIWMYSDCWGEVGWTIIDYYLRRKASFYFLKRAFKPIKTIARKIGRDMIVRVFNDSPHSIHGRLEYGWFHTAGQEVRTRQVKISLKPFSKAEPVRLAVPKGIDTREWVFAAILHGRNFEDTSILRLHPWRAMIHPETKLKVKHQGSFITVQSNVFGHAVHANDAGIGLLDDNYFDLLPGRPKTLKATRSLPKSIRFQCL